MVTRHPSHRIVELLFGSLTCVGVNEWIRGDHRLIHPVEGKLSAIRTPEETAIDAELILVHRLPVDDRGTTISRQLVRRAIGREDKEIVPLDYCSVVGTGREEEGLLLLSVTLIGGDELLRTRIYQVVLLTEGDGEELSTSSDHSEGREELSALTLGGFPEDREKFVLSKEGRHLRLSRGSTDDQPRAVYIDVVIPQPRERS